MADQKETEMSGRTPAANGASSEPLKVKDEMDDVGGMHNLKREQSESFVKKQEKYELWMLIGLVWAARLLLLVAIIGGLGFLFYIVGDSDNWSTDENDADSVRLLREKNRGTLVSLTISVLLNIVGAFMFYIKVKEGLVVTNYGFILGPVVGFLLDQGVGLDEGFAVCIHCIQCPSLSLLCP